MSAPVRADIDTRDHTQAASTTQPEETPLEAQKTQGLNPEAAKTSESELRDDSGQPPQPPQDNRDAKEPIAAPQELQSPQLNPSGHSSQATILKDQDKQITDDPNNTEASKEVSLQQTEVQAQPPLPPSQSTHAVKEATESAVILNKQ